MKIWQSWAFAILVCAAQTCSGWSETHALLLGVSHYGSADIHDLAGPANDLAAMTELVQDIAATDVVTLKDADVSRSSVEAALQQIGARAKPNDWILLYYSGHGAQAVARFATARDGAFDQFLPLTGFDVRHQDPESFIVDKDFYVWLKRYVPTSVRILMLVDTCHSGSMHRAVETRAFGYTPRLAFRGDEAPFQLVPRPSPHLPSISASVNDAGNGQRDDLPNLVYIGASRDDQLAFEVPLPREGAPSRGVLSYAFGQALQMAGHNGTQAVADLDGDGRVSVLELSVYLNSQVRLLTAQRQESAAAFPPGWSNMQILSSLPKPRSTIDNHQPSGVALENSSIPASDAALAIGWRIVAYKDADFKWDNRSGEVFHRSGDLVASGVTSVTALNGVVGKWRTVEALGPFAAELETRLSIEPFGGDFAYPEHKKIAVKLERTPRGQRAGPLYATVFNIASDGTLQLLYPLATDGDGLLRSNSGTLIMETEVVRPFGTDHVMAVTTPSFPEALRAALRAIDGRRAPESLPGLILNQLGVAKGNWSLAIAEIYTSG